MKNNAKPFLKNAVLLTVILGIIIFFMPEWGVAQVTIVLLVALLAVPIVIVFTLGTPKISKRLSIVSVIWSPKITLI